MKRLLTPLVIFLIVLAGGATTLHAQTGPNLPPTIISFDSSLDSITLAQAEAGSETTTLSWQVIGLQAGQRVVLHAYAINAWEPLLRAGDVLPASGAFDVVVRHPHNFGPPTYRLAVLDAAGTILEQRVLVVDYERGAADDPPVIAAFNTQANALDPSALASGAARLPVTWEVTNRHPDSNLVFEQMLEGGRIVSVELPRPNVWIPSQGQGVLAPVQPGTGQPVRLRLRVVNMVDGTTLAESMLPPLNVAANAAPQPPVSQPPVSQPVAPQPAAPASGQAINIVSFTSAPEIVPRGGTITLTWDVRNAAEIGVWLLEPGGPLAQSAPTPTAQGQWTLTLPESYVDTATFQLYATGSGGEQVQSELVIDIICPYTYFFGPTDLNLSCPAAQSQTVQASFQHFERGYMIWRGDTSDIYVLYDSGLVNRFRDSWQGEILYFNEPAPDGLYRPDRSFGKVWIENPQVRSGLGWPLDFEKGYTMTYQRSGDAQYARLYLDFPDGSIAYIVENTWKFLIS